MSKRLSPTSPPNRSKALILAHQESRYKDIFSNTAGIIFFGTPHQGSSLAAYALAIVKLPTVVANRPDPKLLKTLKVGSEVLKNLTEEFQRHHKMRPYPIVSFMR